MHKIVLLLALGIFISPSGFAQTNSSESTRLQKEEKQEIRRNIEKPSRDFLVVALTYDNWTRKPSNIHTTGFSRGFSMTLNYDFPISNSNFSFSAGLGINSSNIFFDKQVATMNTGSSQIIFKDLDSTEAPFYKKSKLSINYLDAPFELRFFSNKQNRNRGFKAALGVHVGLLLDAHSKVKHSGVGMPEVITEKVSTNRYVQRWRFMPSLRVGWGNFSLYGTYSITNVFKEGSAPNMNAYSIGISISGL